MKKILVFALFCFSAIVFAQKPIFTSAKIKSATVYSNSAELLQSAAVTLPSGTSEIVIKNVADYVNENTIQIGAPANVTVLSVQFTRNFISEYEIDESNPMIKKVRDSIVLIEKEMGKIANEKVSYSKTIDLLDKNQNVAGQNSGLNVTELIKLVDYYRAKRNELSNLVDALIEKENKLKDKLSKLNSKLELNTQKQDKTSQGKLVLQVMTDVASSVNLDINYLTNNASWSPFYDLRADNINSPINLMYKAKVVQNTGIDWKKVKLTLSSGNPNQNNTAPILQAWFLRYGYPRTYQYDNSNAKLNTVAVSGYMKKDKAEMNESSISNYTTINENQLNVSFDIDIPYDILSNGKAHSVALKDLKLPATYKYYAVPKVEKEAFLLAEISEYSKFNLLPGEANIIFEGMYVGKTMINPNQTSDTLNLSMGRDKKIAIKREKIADKSGTKFLSGYKEQTFTYDITIKNNKKEAIELLLKDQYPISTDKEITIELLDNGKAKANPETGILTWDIKLGAGETKKFRISYKIKYPKDKFIDNL
ncbi:MAG: mucoidy inhibitor MuiA family protein [Flavobacterium sp.]|nr:MAG: mucoidy inhibitor MuiA family protein [Flavobacterium sp.]